MAEYIPVIELENYRISKLEFKTFDDIEELDRIKDRHGHINVMLGIDSNYDYGRLKIDTTVLDEELNRSIVMEITGVFKINEKEDAEKHLSVNGSAMLFPYLRTFISIVSSLDNPNSLVLPTVNTNNFEVKKSDKWGTT